MGGLREATAGRASASTGVSRALYASAGALERAHSGHGRGFGKFPGARFGAWQSPAHAAPASGNLHRPLLVAYPAKGFQAHPSLRRTGSGGQSAEVGAGPSGAIGSRTRSRGGGIGGGVHVPNRPSRVGTLLALRRGALCSDSTHSDIKGTTNPATRTTVSSMGRLTWLRKRGALGRQGLVRPLHHWPDADAVILDRFTSSKHCPARQKAPSIYPLYFIRRAIRLTRRRTALQSP